MLFTAPAKPVTLFLFNWAKTYPASSRSESWTRTCYRGFAESCGATWALAPEFGHPMSAESQGLAQSMLELRAVGSADPRAVAVLQDHFELAVRDGLKLDDAVDVDDRRSMNSDKAHWIELVGKVVKRGPVEQLLPGDVQIGINTGALDPVDVGHTDKARRSAGFDHQPIQVAAGRRFPAYHAQHAPAEFQEAVLVAAGPCSGERSLETFVAEGFEEIIQCVCFEGTDRVVIIGGYEHCERHFGRADSFDHLQPVKLGHLHIEKDQIERLALNHLDGGFSIGRF